MLMGVPLTSLAGIAALVLLVFVLLRWFVHLVLGKSPQTVVHLRLDAEQFAALKVYLNKSE